MSAPDILANVLEAQAAMKRARLAPLPEAYLRDREHLSWLELVTRGAGRRPFYDSPGMAMRLGGIPIFIDPTVEANVLELRWPDGNVEQIRLDHKPDLCLRCRLADLTDP